MKKDWKYKKLGEVCEVFCDGDWIESKDQSEDGIRLIQTGNVGNGVYRDKADKSKYISEETFKQLNCTEIFPGDILVSRLPDPIGRACIIPETGSRMITAVDCSIIRLKECINSNLFVYYTRSDSYSKNIDKFTTGTTRKRISRSNLALVSVPIPPKDEQQQIVAELDLLSGMIEKQKAQIEELDKLSQSIFYDMFGDPLTNDKGWDVKFISEVADVVGGSTPKTDNEEFWGGPHYWVTPAELKGERYIDTTIRTITDLAIQKTNLTLLPKGTVLLSSRAPIGKVCITRNEMYCNQGFKNIVCSDVLNNEYVYTYLVSIESYLQSLGTGATFKEISKKVVDKVKIPVPPLSLQQEFAAKIEAIEAMKAKVRQSLKESETLFNSRMDYYFN